MELTFYSSNGDGCIGYFSGSSWSGARNASSGNYLDYTSPNFLVSAYDYGYPFLFRGFLPFYIEGLPAGANIESARLYLTVNEFTFAGASSIHIVETNQVSTDSLELDDYDNLIFLSLGIATVQFVYDNGYIDFNDAGLTKILNNSYLKIGLISNFDFDDVSPDPDNHLENGSFQSSEYSNPDFRPRLVITYSLPPPAEEDLFWPMKDQKTGYNCFVQQFIKNSLRALNPFKKPDGTRW